MLVARVVTVCGIVSSKLATEYETCHPSTKVGFTAIAVTVAKGLFSNHATSLL